MYIGELYMELFVYEAYQVKPEPQTLAIKVFRDLWKRDTSEDKSQWLMEAAYIYFMEDPRSDFQYLTNEQERHKAVVEAEGMNENWKPDALVKKAMDYYKSIQPVSCLLLEDARFMVNKLREDMRQVDYKDSKDPIAAMKTGATLIKMIPELVLGLKQAEDTVKQEIIESAQARGSVEQTIFDDDLDI